MKLTECGSQLVLLFPPERIAAEVSRLAKAITSDYAGREVHLVVVLKGAFVFAADLVRQIELPVSLDFIRISSYHGKKSSGGINLALKQGTDLRGRDVLIVEDIVDTGASLDFLKTRLSEGKPRTIRTCALVNKTGARRIAIEPDYWALACSGGFLVGYGLDFDERFRDLPGIYVMG